MTFPITDPVLIVAVAMTIFVLAPLLMQRMRVPGLIGLILAGAVVGPNALNLLARDDTIVLLGTVGLIYLLFMAGAEIDLHGFRRQRNQSLLFGAVTFLIPQLVGVGIGMLLGYGVAASILLGSIFGSHTLVAYPIAMRFGISKKRAVTTTVGGTIIADTTALLVLAVVAASTRGALDVAFWFRMVGSLGAYVALIWFGLPRLGRWFFRNERTGGGAEYVFVLASLFAGAYLAHVAGVEPIVGAFLVGLSLNRLLPEQGLLTNRIHFVGEAFFIPFFLLSVGMLVDVRVFAAGPRAWEVMVAMSLAVIVSKWIASRLSQRFLSYSGGEGWVIFGLSVPHASATLPVALIGVEIGLFDDAVLNGTIMMILVTCVIGPWIVEKYGRRMALEEEHEPYSPTDSPQRILIPMANPATAEALMDLALAVREPGSREALLPLSVVPAGDTHASEYVAEAETMLSHAVAYAASAEVPVLPLTRVDHNYASGITRGVAETRTSTLVVGWDGKRSARRGIFGSVLDQLLDQTRQHVLVAKLGHPLNTTERLVVLVPEGADHVSGFFETVRMIKLMANRLSATIRVHVVASPAEVYREHFERIGPDAPVAADSADGWALVLRALHKELLPDDLVLVLSARRGAISWSPILDRLPGHLADLLPESFIMIYPAELPHGPHRALAESALPQRTFPPDPFDMPAQPSDSPGQD